MEDEAQGQLHEYQVHTKKPSIYESDNLLSGQAYAGRLTKVGMSQALNLGIALRERYGELIVDGLPIYTRSTSTERTIETAQGVLTGMFLEDPPDNVIIRVKQKHDIEYGVANFSGWCRKLNLIYKAGFENDLDDECSKILENYLSRLEIDLPEGNNGYKLQVLFDQLSCRDAAGKPLPNGIEHFESPLSELNVCASKRMFRIFTGHGYAEKQHALQLLGGRMLTRILSIMEREDDEHSLYLFSGHDWSLIMLLSCLDPHHSGTFWPDYCSELSVEKWMVSNQAAIRVLFNGNPLCLSHLTPVSPQHDHLYTYESFKTHLEGLALLDEEIHFKCDNN